VSAGLAERLLGMDREQSIATLVEGQPEATQRAWVTELEDLWSRRLITLSPP
jgi:hypothetical protein